MLYASEVLGGLSRINFQMSSASLEHQAMKRSIELLGTAVAPIVRKATQGAAVTMQRRPIERAAKENFHG